MRTAAIVVCLVAVLIVSAYAFATGGVPGRRPPAWLTARPIAHRGEWSEGAERPENSLAAFEEAAGHGYAIELDVQRAGDGTIVVIHDEDLERLTGRPGRVAETALPHLKTRHLRGGDETIPTLREALDLIDGRVPVFVEIKNEGEVGSLEDAVAERLARYEGAVAVISFNPFSLARIAAVAPAIPRGQLSGSFAGEDLAAYKKFLLRHLLMNWKSRPDFIAYELDVTPSLDTTLQRWRGRPLLGWTAESEADRTSAEEVVDAVIADPEALSSLR